MSRKITVIVYRFNRTFPSNLKKRPILTPTQMRPREVSFEQDESLFTILTRIVPFERWVHLWGDIEKKEKWPAQAGNPERTVTIPTTETYYRRDKVDSGIPPWVSDNMRDKLNVEGIVNNLQIELQQSNWSCTLHIIDSEFVTDYKVKTDNPSDMKNNIRRENISVLLTQLEALHEGICR
jgi:hypothetical protein